MNDTILLQSVKTLTDSFFSTMSSFKKLIDKIQECVSSDVFYLE